MNLPPADQRALVDYPPGLEVVSKTHAVTEKEIVEFASAYDPQYFHVDAVRAAASEFGGLIASGWHTCAMAMRLFFDEFLPGSGALSPGVDELRWRAPVRPGDILHVRVRVEDARISKSRPDRGVVSTFVEVFNQTATVVMSFKAANFILTRAAIGV
ncbi:MAG: MaoC family dehydratase [Rhodospirillaceae bacterium]